MSTYTQYATICSWHLLKWKNNPEFPEVNENMDFAVNILLLNEALASLLFCRLRDLKTKLNPEVKQSCNPQVTGYMLQTSRYPEQQMEGYISVLTVSHLKASLCAFRSYTCKQQINRSFTVYYLSSYIYIIFVLSTVNTCAIWSRSSRNKVTLLQKKISLC